MEKVELKTVRKDEEGYPDRLRNYPGMPDLIYYTGTLPESGRPSAAIVGARSCSSYGRIQAFRFAKTLSSHGVQIISGLASGIDAEGHKGALAGGTPTFAVMGNGADICYPSANRSLYHRILREGGGILSEFLPGTGPLPYHFPVRNRIISALADVVLVVEAKVKSGSLITANYALEQGKSVYAVPGAVNELLSEGCHRLIYDGAGIAYCPEILLQEWGINAEDLNKNEQKKNFILAKDSDLLYGYLDSQPKSLDYLVKMTDYTPAEVSRIVVELILAGLVRETGRQYYVRV